MVNEFDKYLPQWHIPSLLIGFIVGLVLCYTLIDQYSSCQPQGICNFTRGDISILGNCKEVVPLLEAQNSKINFTRILSDSPDIKVCPPCETYTPPQGLLTSAMIDNRESSTPFQEEPTTTTIVQCPICDVCQVCEPGLDNATKHYMMDMKPDKTLYNPAESNGYFLCKRQALTLLNLKISKFNEATANNGFYEILKPANISEDAFVIPKQRNNDQDGFWLNRTLDEFGNIYWAWDSNNCTGSALWVYKP